MALILTYILLLIAHINVKQLYSWKLATVLIFIRWKHKIVKGEDTNLQKYVFTMHIYLILMRKHSIKLMIITYKIVSIYRLIVTHDAHLFVPY